MVSAKQFIGLEDALARVREAVQPLGREEVPLALAGGRILAEDVRARVSSPTVDVSLKDGYALMSGDTAGAAPDSPVLLKLVGEAFAGSFLETPLTPGTAAKILTGGPVPGEADAVVAEEGTQMSPPGRLRLTEAVPRGADILPAGSDIRAGSRVAEAGDCLLPGRAGMLAAAGIESVPVYRIPAVAVLGTGDEVVAPGKTLRPGQLYASNLVTLAAWLQRFDFPSVTRLVPDDRTRTRERILALLEEADLLLTSGGLWGSERDHIVSILDEIGWRKIFHRVRLGPGKGIAFGLWREKPVFCLPGGPPSNEMAFLQLALPGLLLLSGDRRPPFATMPAALTCDFQGRDRAWSQFEHATLGRDREGGLTVTPHKPKSRLSGMAMTTCLLPVREGVVTLKKGDRVDVQILAPLSEALKKT
jgi:molybdopterin molybdotransferase